MANISIIVTTTNTISVMLTNLDTNYGKDDRVCQWQLNGITYGSVTLAAKVSSGGSFTFSGLSAGTTYTIIAVVNGTGWTAPVTISTYAQTTKPAIAKWSWVMSNGTATAEQTAEAYMALVYKRGLNQFSYLVWNDMVDKVNEIIQANGLTWNNAFLSYSNTRMSPTDKLLTAARFNSLRYNIGSRYSTGIDTVSPGDIVYGQYFITFADCINGWIDISG